MKIDELHDKLYELLMTVDRICTENQLHYFVAYGTAIGAVWEGDFIPWDDDMDINVLQPLLRLIGR